MYGSGDVRVCLVGDCSGVNICRSVGEEHVRGCGCVGVGVCVGGGVREVG